MDYRGRLMRRLLEPVRRAFSRLRVALPQPLSRLVGTAAYLPVYLASAQTRRHFHEEAAIDAAVTRGRPLPAGGAGLTERVVEVPWVLRRVAPGTPRLLDVGTAFAPTAYQHLLVRLPVGELTGVDLVPFELRNVRSTVADVRSLPFEDGTFDATICISTLEHIGLDNRIYFDQSGRRIDEDGDVAALRELGRVTRPGGRLLVTVPGGREHRFDWHRQYSPASFARVAEAASLSVVEVEYFAHDPAAGWRPAPAQEVETRSYGEGSPAAAALVCASLTR
jgi:SAM-dependent methyltransferase